MSYLGKTPVDVVDALNVQSLTVDNNLTVDTDTLVVDGTNNNVGIGTSSPSLLNKLDVVADSTDRRIAMRTQNTSGNASVEAQVNNYWSGPTYTGTALVQYDSAATGTTVGLSNANLGALRFQNGSGGLIYTNGAVPLVFGTTGIERVRVQSGGGISFNGDTAAANALDDYEEGTWTPTNAGDATGTIAGSSAGQYTKIGRFVHVQGQIHITANFTGNSIGGLPFTPRIQSDISNVYGAFVGATNLGTIYMSVTDAGTNVNMYTNAINTGLSPTTGYAFIRFAITYETNA